MNRAAVACCSCFMIGAQTGSKFMFGCELHDLSYEPRGQTWDQTRTAQVNVLKETRVEEEMLKLRQRNYKWLARCFSHLGLLGGLGILCEVLAKPGAKSIIFAACWMASYLQYLRVGGDMIELTQKRLKMDCFAMHVLALIVFISTATFASTFEFALLQGWQVAVRCWLVYTFLDPWISIPFQVLYTLTEVLAYLLVFESASLQLGLLCLGHCIFFGVCVSASIFIDTVLRTRIYALLDNADAESLVSSFARVLRGVCDGEVLLDSQMNVAKESECLKHLILTNVSLVGRSFPHLLVEEERPRFNEFIEASARSTREAAAPLCLRVSFRGSAGIRIAADLYHVPVPGLFGASEPYHLLALKEDLDSRPPPDMSEGFTVPELLTSWHGANRRFTPQGEGDQGESGGREPSVRSGSTARSSGVHACPELQEMFLLVDAASQLQDVEQVELNFRRHEEPYDLPSALRSSMPSLRRLVKPTDWEQVRSKVARFAEKSSQDPDLSPKKIHSLAVQLPGQSGWLMVELATLHRNSDEGKVWLHLHGFRPERRHAPPHGGAARGHGGTRRRTARGIPCG
ncbi:unnamed protein product [Durusdinium trenchii]|uniref:Uncharacterized protein n=1 Tax=Durusdinium trenchii TaxID=1381693 RepID=A0ABP0N1T4_9DINO